uniref:DIRP domain-containing protein n=1 Tax=Meloidogyne hapla TaxID=6305 RepID=A0A1I8BAF1_MELHA
MTEYTDSTSNQKQQPYHRYPLRGHVGNLYSDTVVVVGGNNSPSATYYNNNTNTNVTNTINTNKQKINLKLPSSGNVVTRSGGQQRGQQQSRAAPFQQVGAVADLLSAQLKADLRKLKNVLKLPKARRFVLCEYFYSGVDQQIFLAENEFAQLMKESFPNLKCTKMRKPEWREVRRLVGRPRRCSQAFLNEEREALDEKRQKIRQIYEGTCSSIDEDSIDLPSYLPRPPVLGQRIYARVRNPKDGIYAGSIDAVSAGEGSYRVIFEDSTIPPTVIKDYELMFDQPADLLSIQYFLEQNYANRGRSSGITPLSPSKQPIQIIGGRQPIIYNQNNLKNVTEYQQHSKPIATENQQILHSLARNEIEIREKPPLKSVIEKEEKVGNFPVRMLVILVKLCKVLETKKQLISNMISMNDCAERMNLFGGKYPQEFKIKFAQIILDLETVNKLLESYMSSIHLHYNALIPHLSNPTPMDRPEIFRKTCNLRTIGAQKKRLSPLDSQIFAESLKQIRLHIAPKNAAAFQDYIEVHMKQILKLTKQ